MKINQNDRKRKFFGQISYEYEHNANSKLTEKDFRESVIQRIHYMLIFILISNTLILTHQY